MKRRMFGNEHEYMLIDSPAGDIGLLVKRFLSFLPYVVSLGNVLLQKGPDFTPSKANREPLDYYAGRDEGTDMLVNQARAYLDTPSAEYATQECDNILDLIACEKAGEKLFSDALIKLRVAIKNLDSVKMPPNFSPDAAIRLFKNNRAFSLKSTAEMNKHAAGVTLSETEPYEHKFASSGTHDNYMIDSHATSSRLQHFFIPHLIALSVFTGGGCVEYSAEKGRYEFSRSQRFPWMYFPIGTSTKGCRYFLVFRDTETFSPEAYRRMQVISGDANLCEGALLIKYATSAALLEMLEDDEFFKNFLHPTMEKKFGWTLPREALSFTARAACTSALDDLLPTSGYAWTLRNLAEYFAEMRGLYDEKVGFSKDRRAGICLEQELLTKLAASHPDDESDILMPYSDHAFMRKVVEHDMEKFGYAYHSAQDRTIEFPATGGRTIPMTVSHRLRYMEAMCHEIDPDSRFEKAQRKGLFHRAVTPQAISAMMKGAPATTRANRRKIIADKLREVNNLASCHWIGVSSMGSPRNHASLIDPFQSELTSKDSEFLKLTTSTTAD